jgi:hypothetical protein
MGRRTKEKKEGVYQMINPSEEVLRIIVMMTGIDGWNKILGWIDDTIWNHSVKMSVLEEETKLRWSQGRIQELIDLRRILTGARLALEQRKIQADQERAKI